MKFTRVCSVFAFLLAVNLLAPECHCDHVNNKPHVHNNHSHGSGNCGGHHGNSSANSGNSGCPHAASGNSSNSVNAPGAGASPSSAKLSGPGTPPPAPTPSPATPSSKDDAGKAIDQIDQQIEKKKKNKKICLISAAATALTLLLGGALGFGIYKNRKAPQVNVENANGAPATESSETVVQGNSETPAPTDAPAAPETTPETPETPQES
ncbi:early transcribed membrane protein [Plasmodium vivax]|uniref:Early transcribed membrane protein (ETRAMP) n=5 Tax=Plasmodium vivax TaxID=5855 RepID=A5KC26_PLAVS|nr:early transcribed membrane protein (ETRAMP) [Plasmodium vivax]KMZ80057.1 early transcribed membrane protein (etramp) [Plasmodium vivax India VII]KMZ95235.1 early transcribed membrane protein (etramp) [Plasmodium vivax Mauritania I]KNA01773.1 early transcribed membrane protein (etramp) [Plasmodium vivax North Korean]EDL43044.1 early transcribed membrane protein (ETRAMP) [Plasmodium vivax]CAI7718259.1 early transcribed membrane protein [Plasmodium vivax]|eukprot:XP_001612771.1 early transcribed membrane protein (ETRAMP) [Plasmodium vivax Sal-1]